MTATARFFDARRRLCLQLLLAGAAPAWAALDASERLLPTSQSLQSDLALALAHKQPLVVMASLHGCPYCKIVREHHLLPLQRSGALVTQIHFLSPEPLRDWNGVATTHGDMVRQLSIEVAPTVLFYGAAHKEVAERLSGSSIPDFYGAYLDERMQTARAAVQGR
ncbi:hypothetical protein [Comamonas testosteroni]|uniref:hypothetical protein n=1 Tax=Comamonas testosteroni TaxID=285 RepID=UPI0039187582